MFDPIWIGVAFAQCVPLFQIYKIKKTGKMLISLWTYVFLTIAITLFIWHSIIIKDIGFIVQNIAALGTNGSILYLLIRRNGK